MAVGFPWALHPRYAWWCLQRNSCCTTFSTELRQRVCRSCFAQHGTRQGKAGMVVLMKECRLACKSRQHGPPAIHQGPWDRARHSSWLQPGKLSGAAQTLSIAPWTAWCQLPTDCMHICMKFVKAPIFSNWQGSPIVCFQDLLYILHNMYMYIHIYITKTYK